MVTQKTSLSYAYTGNPAQPLGYSAAIKINSLGFLPSAEKKASISTSCFGNFYIRKVSDGSAAYTGILSAAIFNYDTDENLITANFTSFTTPGLYYVDVPGVGRTQEFVIDSKAYNWAFYMSMKGLYLLRCGTSVSWTNPWESNTTFSHGLCHPYPEMAYAGPAPARDVTGGHHDANDCDKYVNVASYTCYLLMRANQEFNLSGVKLDIPESNNSIPDVLNEVKYELQSLLKFQDSDGGVYSSTEQNSIAGWRHEMQNKAFRSTACFCATVATAKRVFQEYDASFADQCWNASVNAYNWLKANPNWSDYLTAYGDYGNGSVEEKYLWAVCEMWVTSDALNLTNKETYLSSAESKISTFTRGYNSGKVQVLTDYWEPENAGLIDYYFQTSGSRNQTLVNTIHDQILTCADAVVNSTQGYGRAVALAQNRDMVAYPWGSCPLSTWPNYLLWAANKISPNSSYTNAALGNIGFIYGRNYFNQSFQTGVGFKPVLRVFDNFEGLCNPTNGYQWPGWFVDGICSFGDKGNVWDENSSSPWVYIEPAFNYTAYVAYALAMFVDTGGSVPVTGVSVIPTSASVAVNATTQLTTTVSPSNATNKNVSWSSSDTSIATVSASGLVTGIAAGSATITVTTQDGNKTATSAITVSTSTVAVTGVSVSPTSASVAVNATTQLTTTVSPSNATNKNVTWSSSNTALATVSASGLVTGIAAGSATITVTTQDGGYTATSAITVNVSSGGSLTGTGISSSATANLTTEGTTDWAHWSGYDHKASGGSKISNYTVVGSGTVNTYNNDLRTLTWSDGTPTASGSNANGIYIAGTNNGFQITAPADSTQRTLKVYVGGWNSGGTLTVQLSDGSAANYVNTAYSSTGQYNAVYTLTYKAASAGQTLSIKWVQSSGSGNVTLQAATLVSAGSSVAVTGVSVSPTSATVAVNATTQLTATVAPSNATNKNVTWSSSNASIATVSASGLVTGIAAGSATITVTTQDGSFTATSAITVSTSTVAVTGVSVSPTSASVAVNATTQLTTTVSPSNATNKNVTWSSSNTGVATVDANGLVTGIAAGTATITVTTQDGGKTATSAITVTVASGGGSLSGSWTSSATAANLTTEGIADWIKWGVTNVAGVNRKAGVPALLTTYTKIGTGTVARYTNDPRPLSWTGGTPTATGTNNTTGVYIPGVGSSFSLTAPADSTQRTLKVYVGGWNSTGRLVAHLSDSSAADFVDVAPAATGQYDRNYVISYKAATAGQTLTVIWTMSAGAGNVTLNGAALQ